MTTLACFGLVAEPTKQAAHGTHQSVLEPPLVVGLVEGPLAPFFMLAARTSRTSAFSTDDLRYRWTGEAGVMPPDPVSVHANSETRAGQSARFCPT